MSISMSNVNVVNGNVNVNVKVNVNVGQRPAASAHKISGGVNVYEISMPMSAEKTSVKSQCQ